MRVSPEMMIHPSSRIVDIHSTSAILRSTNRSERWTTSIPFEPAREAMAFDNAGAIQLSKKNFTQGDGSIQT